MALLPICDVCGFRIPTAKMRKRWDGLWVCPEDWEPRHILDFYRPSYERPNNPPYLREDPHESDDASTHNPATTGYNGFILEDVVPDPFGLFILEGSGTYYLINEELF